MSKIEQLIAEYCPNGVEYRNLEDCCEILDSKRKPVTKSSRQSGEYPYYGANGIQDYVADYIFDGTFVLVGEDGSVITEAGTPVVTWAEGKIWVNNHAHIISEIDGVLLRFLFHCLQTINVSGLIHGNIPKLNQGDFRKLRVPVPPLEVQREIVHILDEFTLLSAELSAELSARRKQYKYYRDSLLSFNDIGGVQRIEVGELFDFKNGINKEKSAFGSGTPIVNFTNVYNKNKLYLEDLQGRVQVSDEEAERYSAKKGDVFFTRTSETQEDIGITSVLLDDIEKCVFSGFVLRARPKTDLLLPEYCAYCFASAEARKYIVRHSTYTTRALTNGGTLSKMIVSVPSKELQKRIVAVLDNFESLCNDLGIGLPAEIEARQKQYEYYRDELLKFKEKKRHE